MPGEDIQTMLSLTDRDAVTAALTDSTIDPALRALIGLRVWQVDTDRRRHLKDILQIVVVLGHASYQSTQWYSHLANDTLLKAVEAGRQSRSSSKLKRFTRILASRRGAGGALFF